MAERPVFISVTVPDGAGKDSCWKAAKALLPPAPTILKIGKPSSIIINGRETFVDQRISRVLDAFHAWADAQRNIQLTCFANTLYVMFQWGVQERYWRSKVHPDMVFSLRDGYVDPVAYAPYYANSTLGKMDIPERISILHKLHGSPFRDTTVFLDVDPSIAVRRIEERLQAEAQIQGRLMRPKWIHQHENVRALTLIHQEFFRVLEYLEENKNTNVCVIDTNELSKQEVGKRLAGGIMSGYNSRRHCISPIAA